MAETFRKGKVENLIKELEYYKNYYIDRTAEYAETPLDTMKWWSDGQVKAIEFVLHEIEKEFNLS